MSMHVLPSNDLKEHRNVGIYCECNPKLEGELVIHRSYDRRENKEVDAITPDVRAD